MAALVTVIYLRDKRHGRENPVPLERLAGTILGWRLPICYCVVCACAYVRTHMHVCVKDRRHLQCSNKNVIHARTVLAGTFQSAAHTFCRIIPPHSDQLAPSNPHGQRDVAQSPKVDKMWTLF